MDIDLAKLEGLILTYGGHADAEEGLCLMEATAYVCGLEHTDNPTCVSPVLGAMGRSLNDHLPDDLRQKLIPLIAELPKTVDDGYDEVRSCLALDWLMRTWLPAWLELSAPCHEYAARLRELEPLVDFASVENAEPIIRAAEDAVRDAAWAAAEDAAWAAAEDAVRAAAEDAAWAAAWDAAEDAMRDAAWAAAGAAAWATARDAAWGGVRDAAWAAAWATARDAAGDGVRAAAGDALRPTVTQLQHSAIELYGRMIRVGS